MDEPKPIQGAVRLGIEIEGIGVVKMVWNPHRPSLMRGLAKADQQTLTPDQKQQVYQIQETLKKQPLVRSNSFSDDPKKDYRGVSIHPEVVTPRTMSRLGLEHPAELVSTPHLLDAKHMGYLKNSVRKVLKGGQRGVLSKGPAPAHTIPASTHLPQATVVPTFIDETRSLPESIQTTVGVAADKLLSDSVRDRASIINFLTIQTDSDSKRFRRLVDAVCTADTNFKAGFTGDQKYRFRLLLLMSLLHAYAPLWKGTGMEKDVYGANIKGYSSYTGCGFEDETALMTLFNKAEGLVKLLVKAKIEPQQAEQAVDKIGHPGLSAQVFFERGSPIACFLVGGRLHTVIEARRQNAPINASIFKFLKSKPPVGKTIDPAATDIATTIKKNLCMT